MPRLPLVTTAAGAANVDQGLAGTSVVFANGDASPGGFSLMRGIPKHFSEGGGVIGAMVALGVPLPRQCRRREWQPQSGVRWHPTEELFLASVLGQEDPCYAGAPSRTFSGDGGTDYRPFDSIDSSAALATPL